MLFVFLIVFIVVGLCDFRGCVRVFFSGGVGVFGRSLEGFVSLRDVGEFFIRGFVR